MRPHVLGLQQPAARKTALQRELKRIEIIVAMVRLQSERGKLRQCSLSRRRIDQVHLLTVEEMMPFAAHVAHLARETEWQLLLDVEIPVLVVAVLSMTVDGFGREELVLRHKERSDGVGEARDIRVGNGVAGYGALDGVAEIVVLVGAVIDAEAGADDSRFIAEEFVGPGYPETRPEIVRIRIVERRAQGAEAATTHYVNGLGTAQYFVVDAVKLIAQAQIERQIGRHLELVLRIADVERAAPAVNALWGQIMHKVRLVADEIGDGSEGDRRLLNRGC